MQAHNWKRMALWLVPVMAAAVACSDSATDGAPPAPDGSSSSGQTANGSSSGGNGASSGQNGSGSSSGGNGASSGQNGSGSSSGETGSSSSSGETGSSSSSGETGSSSGGSSSGQAQVEGEALEISAEVAGIARALYQLGPDTAAPMQISSDPWDTQFTCAVAAGSTPQPFRYVELKNPGAKAAKVSVRVDTDPAHSSYRDSAVAAYAERPAADAERAQCLTGLNDTCRNLAFGNGEQMGTTAWGCLARGAGYDMRPTVPAGGSIWVYVGALDDGALYGSLIDFRLTVTTDELLD